MKKQIKEVVTNAVKALFYPVRKSYKLRNYVKDVVLLDGGIHIEKPVKFLEKSKNLSGSPVIVDIGGAYGTATDLYLEILPHAKVYLFEANPQLAGKLKEKFSGKPVDIRSVALSDNEGEVSFHITDNIYSSSYKTIEKNEQFVEVEPVRVKTKLLDNELSDVKQIDIIKLDVQGAEMDVLKGGLQTLKKTKLIVVEQTIRSTYTGGAMYFEVDQFLREQNFEMLDIYSTYRKAGYQLDEFDAVYFNRDLIQL